MSSHWWGSCSPQMQTEKDAFWYMNLSETQLSTYEQFKKHLQGNGLLAAGQDDQYDLLRFLKARQWNITKATDMYENMGKWRKEKDVDNLYQNFKFTEENEVLKHYPHYFHKTDKYGRPVYIEMLGKTDSDKILDVISLEKLIEYHVYEWEKLRKEILVGCSKTLGRPVLTKSVILDLKGLSMKNFGTAARKILRAICCIDQDYYPEHLGQMFITNAPTIFRAVWAVVTPLLEERTRRKIVILGADYLATVSQVIPLENLPTELGGKSKTSGIESSGRGPLDADAAVFTAAASAGTAAVQC